MLRRASGGHASLFRQRSMEKKRDPGGGKREPESGRNVRFRKGGRRLRIWSFRGSYANLRLSRIEAQRSGFDSEKEEPRSIVKETSPASAPDVSEPCGACSDAEQASSDADAPSREPPLRKREPRRLTGMCLTCRNTCATPVMPVSEQQPPTNVILSYTQ